MNSLSSYADGEGLLRVLNRAYGLNLTEIKLHRAMIGSVYFAKSGDRRYVAKLHRSFNGEQALQSIDIIQYLKQNDYPVPSLILAKTGKPYIEVGVPDGQCLAMVYDYVEGSEPDLQVEIERVGKQVGELHRLMAAYDKPLIRRGKEFYIDRFIRDLRLLKYEPGRVRDLENYGAELWAAMERLPHGFCHGDLHSGNMFQTANRDYVLIDFDIASDTYSIIDVATLSNLSGFNRLEESSYEATERLFDRFYQGYSQVRTLSQAEIAAMFDFIAIRHYELIATITECESLNDLSQAFLDQQYGWLMQWRDICQRKRA